MSNDEKSKVRSGNSAPRLKTDGFSCHKAYKIMGLFLFSFSVYAQSYPINKTINIGVIAYNGVENTINKWQPTVNYLQTHLSLLSFILMPMSLEQLYTAIKNNELQFVLSNPGFYYTAKQYGLEPMTSLINKKQGKALDQFGAIIFTRADRVDINNLTDVKGKSFAAVSELAFGGFQMAWREFKDQEVYPFRDFKPMLFTGFPQYNIVKMVEQGYVDVGTVRTDIIEHMQLKKAIKIADFKILNQQNREDFPFLLSTRLYPDYVMSKTKNVSKKIAEQVRYYLVSIAHDSKEAIAGNYMGWTNKKRLKELFNISLVELMNIEISIFTEIDYGNENKYQDIDMLMKDLKIGPYEDDKKVPSF